jgi:hypothetical protein
MMTTSKVKAKVGLLKGIVAPDTEGYIDILNIPIQVQNKETTLGALLSESISLHHTLSLVSKRVEAYRLTLKRFLQGKGYDVSNDTLLALFEAINGLDVLNPTDTHHVALLEDGYIRDVIDINLHQVLRNAVIPEDIKQGFYKVSGGKIVLDEVRREELEELV